MPDEIVMRHRPPHFAHVFSGGGYAAAYYSYMWSEVLDADAFEAFEETGDIFDPATAKRLRETIYAAGGARDPADAYKAFRGRLPSAGRAVAQARIGRAGCGSLSMVDLHSAGHRRGVVCAPHYGAVEAGRSILAEGGNALEAMVAMAASIAAVYPHMNHIGGDGFWLIREPNGRVRAIMAAGPAGDGGAARALPRARDDTAARAARRAHRAGRRRRLDAGARGGEGEWRQSCRSMSCWRRPSARPATAMRYRAARRGSRRKSLPSWRRCRASPKRFWSDGKPPAVGAILKQEALAETLAHLAHAGLDDFYRGDVGREIAADLDRIGSPLTREDLTRYRATLAEPLRVELPEGTVYNTDAPTQGVASLMILALFARLGVTEAEGFDHIHGLVEATKRALRVRDRVVTDPNHLAHALDRCLEPRFIAGEAMKIDRRKAAPLAARRGEGDTVWMGAADTSGLVVSYIQSLYWEFGSGCVLPRTGVLMQNRGISFSLQRGALNLLAPGRLPFHTLNPALAVLKDGRVMAYGAMGGDGQPQTQGAVFTRHVLFGEPLAEAIDRPRWLLGRTWGDRANQAAPGITLRRQSRRSARRGRP